uniref:SWIM-type domain-containing protein n=1 Tax=Macrostomum lignano TaxID=282301 RepID=A0A1I8FHE2_9PLAT
LLTLLRLALPLEATGSVGRRSSAGGRSSEAAAAAAANPSLHLKCRRMPGRRLAKAMRIKRCTWLQQRAPILFLVGDDNLSSKYRVIIGSQTCTCGRGPPNCVHILFVMLRNYEVEGLFQNYHEREKPKCKKRPSFRDSRSTNTSVDEVVQKDECFIEDEEDQNTCSICLLKMTVSDSLVQCQFGLPEYFPFTAAYSIMIWFEERNAHGDAADLPAVPAASGRPIAKTCRPCPAKSMSILLSTRSPTPSRTGVAQGDFQVLDFAEPVNASWVLKFVNDLVVSRLMELRSSANLDLDQLQVFAPTISVLVHACKDEEYKVFYAAVNLMRNLFIHLPCNRSYTRLQTSARPLVETLLNRCSDRHQRVTQLALFNLVELAKNHAGCLAIGSALRPNPVAAAVASVAGGGGGGSTGGDVGGVCGGVGGCRGG